MSTFAFNYALWSGAVGVVLEYFKRRGYARWETVLSRGLAEKAVLNLLATYLQQQNITLIGSGLDANYIYNAILGSLFQMVYHDKTKLQGAEEQVICSLIGHRLATQFSQAFDFVTSNFPSFNNMFGASGGYTNATIPNPAAGIPSMNSGNNTPAGGNSTMY